jgi:hypothetical protein
MSEREAAGPKAASRPRLEWIVAPWLQPFWYAYLAHAWWRVAETTNAGGLMSGGALVAAAKLAGALTEAAFYVLWWRSRGRGLPFWRFFCVVASISLADVFAIGLAERLRTASPGAALWLAPLVGFHALGSGVGSSGLRAAFGGLGLLTVLRIFVTARAQSRGTGARFAAALGWTALFWIMGRVAMWWLADLLRGRSPLPVP